MNGRSANWPKNWVYRSQRSTTGCRLAACRQTAGQAGSGAVVIRYRRPKDRRSRADQWADAIDTLSNCLDGYQEWRDNLPASLADSALAERLDAMLEWRDLVDQLSLADLPRGFGRD